MFSDNILCSACFLDKRTSWQADRTEAGGEADTTVGDKEMTLLRAPPPCELWQCWRRRWSATSCSVTAVTHNTDGPPESGLNSEDGTEHAVTQSRNLQVGFCEARKSNFKLENHARSRSICSLLTH